MTSYFLLGAVAAGFSCSYATTRRHHSSAKCAPVVNQTLSRTTEGNEIRFGSMNGGSKCVIIGGGFSGSKAAFMLDSSFEVTLIDEKNFVEESVTELAEVIARPWDEDWSPKATRKLQHLHRFFLKNANIMTSTACHISDKEVTLIDGRSVPYDVLVLATGEQKAFPFSTQQKTIAGRNAEIKHFNRFLHQEDCQKIAIVGGGPLGVALACFLTQYRPDKEVVLIHSHGDLVGCMPSSVRKHVKQSLDGVHKIGVTLRKLSGVPAEMSFAEKSEAIQREMGTVGGRECGLKVLTNTVVTDIEGIGKRTMTVVHPMNRSILSSEMDVKHDERWWGFLGDLFKSRKIKVIERKDENKVTVSSTSEGGTSSTATSVAKDGTTLKTGKNKPLTEKIQYWEEEVEVPSKFNLKCEVYENDSSASRQNNGRSLLHQLYFCGDAYLPPYSKHHSGNSENRNLNVRQQVGENTLCGFDYVFNLTGGVARPIIGSVPQGVIEAAEKAGDKKKINLIRKVNQDVLKRPNLLSAHTMPDGHYRVSILNQLLGHPHIFALGPCNSFPWVRSDSSSDIQVKSFFRNINTILMTQPSNPKLLDGSTDGLQPQRMAIPRIIIPLGYKNAAGSTFWSGGVISLAAEKEYQSDLNQLYREFRHPIFFKTLQPDLVRKRIDIWKHEDITDVTDFSYE
eukprot:Tbor_TRINITY_DN10028_c0_g1::TRINITY_DN10028_c0_g1_i1::g.12263::m.12263